MAIRERIRKTFIDTTDLDLAHQEIGYLKDLCDAKDNVIAYQKELMQVQSESIKEMRNQLNNYEGLKKEHEELKKEVEELKNGRENARTKHNTRNKSRS